MAFAIVNAISRLNVDEERSCSSLLLEIYAYSIRTAGIFVTFLITYKSSFTTPSFSNPKLSDT